MYEVGGQLLSREPHRGNRVTIHGEGGEKTVLTLKFTGMEPTRFGEYYAYTVVKVTSAGKPQRKLRARSLH